jgi:hypothetical protein
VEVLVFGGATWKATPSNLRPVSPMYCLEQFPESQALFWVVAKHLTVYGIERHQRQQKRMSD